MADKFFVDGEAYERFMGRWSRAVGECFIDWLALPKGLRWLDVGCGTGAFTQLLLDRCDPSQVGAIDPSTDQIAFAKTRPAAGRVDFRVGDAMAMPYRDGEFDVAAMALVINFVPDAAKAVAEMKRVVTAGGTVTAYIWDLVGKGFTQQPVIDALAALGIGIAEIPGNANTSLDRLKAIFEAAGLSQVTVRRIDIEVSYDDFDTYWASQTGLPNPAVQAIRKMPEADVDKLKALLRERLPLRDGRIAYPAWANAVRGLVPA